MRSPFVVRLSRSDGGGNANLQQIQLEMADLPWRRTIGMFSCKRGAQKIHLEDVDADVVDGRCKGSSRENVEKRRCRKRKFNEAGKRPQHSFAFFTPSLH
jgi:hypothetical protein